MSHSILFISGYINLPNIRLTIWLNIVVLAFSHMDVRGLVLGCLTGDSKFETQLRNCLFLFFILS